MGDIELGERVDVVENRVKEAERAVSELEMAYGESRSSHTLITDPAWLARREREEAHHQETLARVLRAKRWADALTLMEERSERRLQDFLKPSAEELDLKVVLRARILAAMLEAGRRDEAFAFLAERAELANRRAHEISSSLKAGNRLRQGQLDTITGKRRQRPNSP